MNSDGWKFGTTDAKLYTKKQKVRNLITRQIGTIAEIGIPRKGEQIRAVTNQPINAWSLVEFFLEKHGTIDEMYLATYTISNLIINDIIEVINSKRIKSANIIVCNFFRNVKEKWYLQMKLALEKLEHATFSNAHLHTKVIIIKNKGQHFVFEGSGNLSNNAKYEQYLFEENQQIYEFHKSWMTEIIEAQHKTKEEWGIKIW